MRLEPPLSGVRCSRVLRRALVLALAGAAGCAKMGPPTGGPEDRQAPEVVRCDPAPDATGVDRRGGARIVFSEPMDRRATEEAVYLSPVTPVHCRWSGAELRLQADGGLLPDRTYVVTVGTDARDRRGNRLERSFTFAFATGRQLNRGRLHGAVTDGRGPASGARVWAYDVAGADGSLGELGVAPPSYQTQTGRDGTYEFQRLSSGTYRVIAFSDANGNGRCDAGEAVALPAGDAGLEEGGDIALGDLALAEPSGEAPRLERAQAVEAARVLLAFDRPVPPAAVALRIAGLEVGPAWAAPGDGSKVYWATAAQEGGATYRLEVAVAGQPLPWKEPLRGSRRADRTPPAVVEIQPGAVAASGDTIALSFGEPVGPVPGPEFWVADDTTEVPSGQWRQDGAARLTFAPDAPWAAGPHALRGRLHRLRDLADLTPVDSFVTVRFEVVDAAGLAALAGRVRGGRGAPVWVEVRSDKPPQRRLVQADAAGTYAVDGLLPATIEVKAFEDGNGNGSRDGGRRHPYEPAEAHARLASPLELGRGARATDVDLELR
ncbi:MAG: Ig-like domain-containing protein [Gemmatimonadota bacterium]